jgi:4-hydroxy-tetrahydrodipicolinate reductase
MQQKLQQITVAIIGSNGKMGKLVDAIIQKQANAKIVARITEKDDLNSILQLTQPDVALEFRSNLSVFTNAATIIKHNVRPIIGSSGLNIAQINQLQDMCQSKSLGGLVIPNFSLGMALLSNFSRTLKEYYNNFSLIEYHHQHKNDKPSGTAKYLANILNCNEAEIGSIRSSGFKAKQQIYVSAAGERIILDHEVFDNSCYEAGILLALNKVVGLNQLIIGLENILI